ncbi:hypothetical protein LIA77_03598 [Sarocladium implicatum]|nr:hypothetical protein LIA77_03598 [Sarocladium implicatum]
MEDIPIPARPPTPQVLIHQLPDKTGDALEPAQKPSKYIILITGPITVPGKVQITHSVARSLSCPSYIGDSVHSSSAKVAGVGAGANGGANEERYQRMWLKKMTRTGLLFPEESRPATEGFSGFGGGTSSTATSRRGSESSVSSIASYAVPSSSDSSNRGESVARCISAEVPSTGSNAFFTLSETDRLRRANPALMVLAHPELESWHKAAIRNALRDFSVTGRMLGSIGSALQNSHSARGYKKLSIVSPIDGTKCCHEPQRPSLAYRLFQLMTIMLLASTTILVILYSMTFKSLADCRKFTNTNSGLLTCGESVAEAKGMGCDFDLLAKAWLPAACPRHGLADFTASVRTALMGIGNPNGNDNGDKSEVNQWRYYSAKHNGRGISIDELAAMADHLHNDTQYWTTRREHSVHCA